MDHNAFLKQVFNLHRSAFENVYNGIVSIKDQAEKTAAPMLENAPWMNEEARNAVGEWRKLYKKGRDDFKRAVDDGYEKLESYLSPPVDAGKKGAEKSR